MADIYGRLLNANSRKVADSSKAIANTDDILLSSIYSNDENFYPMDDIRGLALEIYMAGLIEPLAVKRAPCDRGEYCLISGERRWRALKFLVEQGEEGFERVSVCIRAPKNIHEEMVELIVSNSYRSKDTATLLREEKALKEHLKYMKENQIPLNGYDLQKGRLRDIVAEILNVSPTKVGELEAIQKHLSPEFREKLEDGQLNASTAYNLSKLSNDEQADMLKVFDEKQKLSSRDIERHKKMRQKEGDSELTEGVPDAVSDSDTEGEQRESGQSDRATSVQEKSTESLTASGEPEQPTKNGVTSFDAYLMDEYGMPLWKYIREKLPWNLVPKVGDALANIVLDLIDGYINYIEKEMRKIE